MTTTTSIIAKLMHVNGMHIEQVEVQSDYRKKDKERWNYENSAKSEATNTTIKALIKMARGFRNLNNMFALIMLRCSDIVIPLNNRYRPDAELQARKRELANQRKVDRKNAKREAHGFRYSPTQGA